MLLQSNHLVTSIRLNGEPFESTAATLADLVTHQGWQGKRIAIELNGVIVPRSLYTSTELKTDDALEVVVAVGGG